jgi:hypothetical protein
MPPFLLGLDIEPMETKSVETLPAGDNWQFEPKWDGFRCLVFEAGKEVHLRARSGKSLSRYFPEMVEAIHEMGSPGSVQPRDLAHVCLRSPLGKVTGGKGTMPYELRVGGRAAGRYEMSGEAEKQARQIIRSDADSVVEIIDLSTGRPYAPASGVGDREALAKKIGY